MIKISKLFECLKNPGFHKSYFYGVAPVFELSPLLEKIENVNTLIDVGSNKGQFGLIARKFFPNIKYIKVNSNPVNAAEIKALS